MVNKYSVAVSKNPCASLPPHLQAEWHNSAPPEKVARRTLANWRCSVCGHEWLATKERRLEGQGCPSCASKAPIPSQEPQEATQKPQPVPDVLPAPNTPLGVNHASRGNSSHPALGVNHVALLVDTSGSMARGPRCTMRVDAQCAVEDFIKSVAAGAQKVPTKFSLYTFSNMVRHVFKDENPAVVGVPFLNPSGGTALRDAVARAVNDLSVGDKASDGGPLTRLIVVITDGGENGSQMGAQALKAIVEGKQATDLWTFALLVPKGAEEKTAQITGIPIGNIRGWDVAAQDGAKEAAQATVASVGDFYQGRQQGVTRTKRFFVDTSSLTPERVDAATKPVKATLFTVEAEATIRDFVEGKGLTFVEGRGYYELTKGELLRDGRNLLIAKRTDGKGKPLALRSLTLRTATPAQMRSLLGLPETGQVPIGEGILGDWRVFVQSTSFNRKLVRGTLFVYLDGADVSVGPTWRPDPAKYTDIQYLALNGDVMLCRFEDVKGVKVGGFVKVSGTLYEVTEFDHAKMGSILRIRPLP